VILGITATAILVRHFRATTPPPAAERVAKPAVAVLNFEAIGTPPKAHGWREVALASRHGLAQAPSSKSSRTIG
jgi:hypothetical protein